MSYLDYYLPDRYRKQDERRYEKESQLMAYQAALAGSPFVSFAEAIQSTPRKEKSVLTSMLERLRSLPSTLTTPCGIDVLVELAAYGRQLSREYELQDIPRPKWLDDNLHLLATEIKTRHRADLERQLREAEAEVEALRSREEKRAAKEAEVRRLREQLDAGAE